MRKRISLLLIAVVLIMSVFSTFVFATEVTDVTSTENENIVTTGNNEDIIKHDIFEMHNEDYVMDQLVNGNAFIMVNGDVRITGEINGSAFIMANGTVELTENGLIIDSLYVMAKKVIISGAAYDIYSLSQNFEMTSVGYVERDVNIAAGNVKIVGEINRNANVSAESITVKDDKNSLSINGNFTYTSTTEIEGLDEIVLNGEIKYTQPTKDNGTIEIPSAAEKVKGYVRDIIASIIYVLVIYFLFRLISPKFNERIGKDLKEKSIVGFAIGLLSYVLIAIVAILTILLAITLIGIPIAALIWILIILGLFISSAVFQIAIFEIVSEKYDNIKSNTGYTILTLIGISICVSVLKIIPYIGGIVGFVVVTLGLGLLVRNIIVRGEKLKEIEEVKEEN